MISEGILSDKEEPIICENVSSISGLLWLFVMIWSAASRLNMQVCSRIQLLADGFLYVEQLSH